MTHTPLRVLCVDDNRDAADSESVLLELLGYDAAVSYDGPEALAEALRFGPDVCLVDYNMPGMNGCEFARRLRALRRGRPVYLIAVTANSSDQVRGLTAAAGFNLHLVKPVDWDELSTILENLDHARGRGELVSR